MLVASPALPRSVPVPPPPSCMGDPEAVEAAAFVLALRARGIRHTAVLGAMERVPRELFAPGRFADLARADVALPLPCGQTMTTPGVIATMLAALGVGPGHRVLEVGTGSGYVTALLARLGCQVRSVERYASLAESAAARLGLVGAGDQVTLHVADGLALDLGQLRFDRVLLNGVAPALPAALTSLLAPGGRLVGGLAPEGQPRLVQVDRGQDGTLSQSFGPALRLSPLAAGRAACL